MSRLSATAATSANLLEGLGFRLLQVARLVVHAPADGMGLATLERQQAAIRNSARHWLM